MILIDNSSPLLPSKKETREYEIERSDGEEDAYGDSTFEFEGVSSSSLKWEMTGQSNRQTVMRILSHLLYLIFLTSMFCSLNAVCKPSLCMVKFPTEKQMGKAMMSDETTPSVSFELQPTSPTSQGGGLWGRFINKMKLSRGLHGEDQAATSAARNRRVIRGDEEQEFQIENTHCLSSHYSVFVARLAIMVI